MHPPNFTPALLLLLSAPVFAGITPTTLTLVASSNPTLYGHPVTFSASVSPSTASGKVTFYNSTAILETEPVVTGAAVLTTTQLPSGTDSIRAYYSGDAMHSASSSSVVVETVTAGAANGFLVPVDYSDQNAASYVVAIGDFNGDGKLDLATASGAYDFGAVSVFLGNGDGTFQTAVQYAAPYNAINLAVGDFNGDGKPDLVVVSATYSYTTVSVLLGNGDGTFGAAVSYTGPEVAEGIAVADFNGDGIADLVVTGIDTIVLLGSGSGAFYESADVHTDLSNQGVVVGDFNQDGIADIAAPNWNSDVAVVWLGNGDGTFQAPINTPATSGGAFIAAGDINLDGKLDLVVTNPDTFDVQVLLGNGDGTFQSPVSYNVGNEATALAIADFNGDGKPDLAVSTTYESETGGVTVLYGNGDGTFQPGVTFGTQLQGAYIIQMGVADFNGDGRPDLAVPDAYSDNVAILLGNAGAATRTTLVSSIDPSSYGEFISLTATIVPSTATGSVTFEDGGTALGSGTVVGGTATFDISTLSTGSHSLTAFYGGDANDGNGVSPVLNQKVVQATSRTKLSSSVNPSTYGETITLVASVSPNTATGTVTFQHGSTVLGSSTMSGGNATFSTPVLTVGSHSLTAVYGGDVNDLASTSSAITQTVIKTPTATKLTSSPNPSSLGRSVTLTAAVAPLTATGTVTFKHGSTTLGTSVLSHGQATFSTSTLSAGSHSLTAVYGGDADDDPSTSAAVIQVVQ